MEGEICMAKMNCKCGYVLSTTEVPNDIELWVYTDKEWEALLDCKVIIPWRIPLPKRDVWMCPKCKRVYVFEKGNSIPKMRYVLEGDGSETKQNGN